MTELSITPRQAVRLISNAMIHLWHSTSPEDRFRKTFTDAADILYAARMAAEKK